MTHLALRRLLIAVPSLLVVSIVVFVMIDLLPGDPAALLAGDGATTDQIEQVRRTLGLDVPLPQRYAQWLWHALQGDLGHSLRSGEGVAAVIGSHLETTVSLMAVSLVIAVTLGLIAGVLAASRARSGVDRAVTALSSIAIALPPFWISLLLVIGLALNGWLPAVGYAPFAADPLDWLKHLVLPALALSALPTAELALQLKESLADELKRDYVLVAQAKGLTRPVIIFKHALRNAAIPVVTVLGYRMAQMLGGTVTIEVVFVLPGLGATTVSSVQARDVPVLLGLVVLTTLAVAVINLLVDISYGYFNPKVRT